VAIFWNAVKVLFSRMNAEALSFQDIRQHVLSTTHLNENQMHICLNVMVSEQKMLQTADYYCII
jgi:hypothetical protein